MIEVIQGDDCSISIELTKADGTAYDLTGCTLLATVKRDWTDTDAAAPIHMLLTIAAPTSGIATWPLTPTLTKYMSGMYKYDIQLKDNVGKVTTLEQGDFLVNQGVTIGED